MSATRLLRLREVRQRVALGRSTLYQLIAAGAFPKPIRIGARSVAWLESEVEDWINARVRESRSAEAG